MVQPSVSHDDQNTATGEHKTHQFAKFLESVKSQSLLIE